jgi:glycosyltransferase involved in cell wall biosynthesis
MTKSAPKVTVVMAVRNGETTVGTAVESILTQNMGDFELFVIDDGSDDSTSSIVHTHARADSRVSIITQRQQLGRAVARNHAIIASRAPYIAIADADDISLPDRLSVQLQALSTREDLVAIGAQVADFGPWGGPVQTVRYPVGSTGVAARFDRGHNAIPHQASMIRRAAFAQAGLYEPALRRCQDHELFLRLRRVGDLDNLPDVLVHYQTDARAPSLRYFRENARYRAAALYLAKAKELDGWAPRSRMAAARYIEILRWARSRKRRQRDVQELT